MLHEINGSGLDAGGAPPVALEASRALHVCGVRFALRPRFYPASCSNFKNKEYLNFLSPRRRPEITNSSSLLFFEIAIIY